MGTYSYVNGNALAAIDQLGLVNIGKGVSGASKGTSIHANPGPGATNFRPEHEPAHIHLGSNDGPRVKLEDWQPYSEEDARKMTKEQKKFCSKLSDSDKTLIKKRQDQVFKFGRTLLTIQGGGLLSIAAACRNDPMWCLEQIEQGVLP